MGTLFVITILAAAVIAAVISMVKKHKNGGGCNCDCGHCSGCH